VIRRKADRNFFRLGRGYAKLLGVGQQALIGSSLTVPQYARIACDE